MIPQDEVSSLEGALAHLGLDVEIRYGEGGEMPEPSEQVQLSEIYEAELTEAQRALKIAQQEKDDALGRVDALEKELAEARAQRGDERASEVERDLVPLREELDRVKDELVAMTAERDTLLGKYEGEEAPAAEGGLSLAFLGDLGGPYETRIGQIASSLYGKGLTQDGLGILFPNGKYTAQQVYVALGILQGLSVEDQGEGVLLETLHTYFKNTHRDVETADLVRVFARVRGTAALQVDAQTKETRYRLASELLGLSDPSQKRDGSVARRQDLNPEELYRLLAEPLVGTGIPVHDPREFNTWTGGERLRMMTAARRVAEVRRMYPDGAHLTDIATYVAGVREEWVYGSPQMILNDLTAMKAAGAIDRPRRGFYTVLVPK